MSDAHAVDPVMIMAARYLELAMLEERSQELGQALSLVRERIVKLLNPEDKETVRAHAMRLFSPYPKEATDAKGEDSTQDPSWQETTDNGSQNPEALHS